MISSVVSDVRADRTNDNPLLAARFTGAQNNTRYMDVCLISVVIPNGYDTP